MRSRTVSAGAFGAFCLGVLVVAPGVWAATPGTPGVLTQYAHPTLTLQVGGPTDLRTVLEAICQVSQSRCQIAPRAEETAVAPMTLVGHWKEVVAKLLEGTKLNYVAVEPGPGRAGQLLVEARRAVGTVTLAGREAGDGTVTSSRSSLTDEEIRRLRARQAENARVTPPLTPAERPSRTDEEIAELRSRGGSLNPNPPAPSPPLSEQMAGLASTRAQRLMGKDVNAAKPDPEQIRKSQESIRMLYEGLSKLNPGPPPTTFTLPYPDPNGNPIVVPYSNQPLTVLPWPGPDGRPIIVTPGPPSQKLQYPIPPTHPPVKKD